MLDPKYSTIQEYLDNPRLNSCELVKFNWRVFTDNDQLDFEDRHPMERFPIETSYKYENRHVKSTVRGRLNYKNYTKTLNPHSIWSDIKKVKTKFDRENRLTSGKNKLELIKELNYFLE